MSKKQDLFLLKITEIFHAISKGEVDLDLEFSNKEQKEYQEIITEIKSDKTAPIGKNFLASVFGVKNL